MRSCQSASIGCVVITLPRSSAKKAGAGETPAICIVHMSPSGNARPMPSASISGNPIRAHHETSCTPLPPPISEAISAATGRLNQRSAASQSSRPSSPESNFSMQTVGAPQPPTGKTKASPASSSARITVTGPHSAIAACAIMSGIRISPPPPVPSTAQPWA